MKHWIDLINFAALELDKCDDGLITYNDDPNEDHQDGQFVGRRDAYRKMIAHCADELAKEASGRVI